MQRIQDSAGRWLAGMLLLAAGAVAQAQQGEAALMKRAGELRDAPGAAGRSIASLPALSPLTRLAERQGPWIQVRSASGATGWVHMFDVGPATGAGAPSGNAATSAMRGVSGLFSKDSATSATSTVGIRGLGAQDIANAQPDLNGMTRMEALRQNEDQARQFAAQAPLAPATVPALPVPAKPRATPSGSSTGQM